MVVMKIGGGIEIARERDGVLRQPQYIILMIYNNTVVDYSVYAAMVSRQL